MKFIDAVPLIESYFATNYTSANILFDNAGGRGDNEFVQLKIHPSHTKSVIKNNGSNSLNTRYFGVVSVYVYTEKNKGSRKAMSLAQDALDTLSHKRIGDSIVFRAGDLRRIGPDDEYYRYVADIPYVIN